MVYGELFKLTSIKETDFIFGNVRYLPVFFGPRDETNKLAFDMYIKAAKRYSDVNPMWIDDPEISRHVGVDPETWP